MCIRDRDTTALTINREGDASFGADVTIAGDLTVNGTTTTINTQTLSVEDPLIELARDNAANSVDIGLFGKYTDSGTAGFLGIFNDASDGNKFKIFKGLTVEPTTTVNTSGAGYVAADLVVAGLESNNIIVSNASTAKISLIDTTNTATLSMFARDSDGNIGTESNHKMVFNTNNTKRLELDAAGSYLVPGANGTMDLGTSTTRWKSIFLTGTINSNGAANFENTISIEKPQLTNQFDTSSFLRLHPSSTINSSGYTNMFFGTSTANNFGVAIGAVRQGTGDTNSSNDPAFVVRILNDSITGTEVLRIGNSLNASFAGDITLAGNISTSTGDLALISSSGEFILYGATNGQTNIYHNGIKKLETTSTGIGVSGNVALSGDLNITQTTDVGVLNTTNLESGAAVGLSLSYPTSNVAAGDGLAISIGILGRGRSYIANSNLTTNLDASNLEFYTENGGVINKVLTLSENKSATFEGNVTVSDGSLSINKSDGAFISLLHNNSLKGYLGIANQVITGGSTGDIGLTATTNLVFGSGGTTERMRITSVGNVEARRPRSNTAGEVALSLNPSDSTIHYGFRVDIADNAFHLDRVDSALNLLKIKSSGDATFAGNVTISKSNTAELQLIDTTNNVSLLFGADDSNTFLRNSAGLMLFQTNGGTTALTLSGANATFAGATTLNGDVTINRPVTISPNTVGKNTFQFTTNASNDGRLLIKSIDTVKVDIQANGDSYFNGGNVGIGTDSPSTKLHIGGTAPGDSIIRQDSTASGTNWEIGERAAGKWQIFEDDGDSIVATFMSSGNVGIGTDSPTSQLFVNNTSDGDKIRWGRSDALVGSLGTFNGVPYIGYQGGAGGGIMFNGSSIEPTLLGATRSDDTNSLGSANNRWKDIYIGQGIFLGGTGTANRLDDYEEGTFTPVIQDLGGNPATLATALGTYTKIGRQVIFNYDVRLSSKASMTGSYVHITLPFNHAASLSGTGTIDKFNNMNQGFSGLSWDVTSTVSVAWLMGVVAAGAVTTIYPPPSMLTDTTKFKGTIIYHT